MVPTMSMSRPSREAAVIVRAVTVILGTVVGLTFLFGFGNVLNLALRLGVPPWVAPLVAPAVDLSVIALLLGTRHLALTDASSDVLRPARRLLIFASVVTLALNGNLGWRRQRDDRLRADRHGQDVLDLLARVDVFEEIRRRHPR